MGGEAAIQQRFARRRSLSVLTEQRDVFPTPAESSGADGQGGGRAQRGEEGKDSGFADRSTAVVESEGHMGHGPEARKYLMEDGCFGVCDGVDGREEAGIHDIS